MLRTCCRHYYHNVHCCQTGRFWRMICVRSFGLTKTFISQTTPCCCYQYHGVQCYQTGGFWQMICVQSLTSQLSSAIRPSQAEQRCYWWAAQNTFVRPYHMNVQVLFSCYMSFWQHCGSPVVPTPHVPEAPTLADNRLINEAQLCSWTLIKYWLNAALIYWVDSYDCRTLCHAVVNIPCSNIQTVI